MMALVLHEIPGKMQKIMDPLLNVKAYLPGAPFVPGSPAGPVRPKLPVKRTGIDLQE